MIEERIEQWQEQLSRWEERARKQGSDALFVICQGIQNAIWELEWVLKEDK